MEENTFELVEMLKTGICPFTGQRYDCGRCNHEPEKEKPPCRIHMSVCIASYIEDNAPMSEYRRLARAFTSPKCNVTGTMLRQYFQQLYALGVRTIPIGECDRFCYREGCCNHHCEEL